MGNFIIKVILTTINNICHNLVYLEWHPNNYLITSGKYPTYHLICVEEIRISRYRRIRTQLLCSTYFLFISWEE
jgi:hypothetical protein